MSCPGNRCWYRSWKPSQGSRPTAVRLCDHQQAAYPLCCAHGAQIPCFPLRDSSGGLKLSICNRVCTAPPRVHGLLCLRHKPAGPDPTQRQRMWVWGKRGHTMTCSHPEWGHRHPRLAQRPWSHPKCGHRYPLAGRHPLAGTDTPGGHRGRGLTHTGPAVLAGHVGVTALTLEAALGILAPRRRVAGGVHFILTLIDVCTHDGRSVPSLRTPPQEASPSPVLSLVRSRGMSPQAGATPPGSCPLKENTP